MTVPVELTLKTTVEGVRMFANPVKEVEELHEKVNLWENVVVKPGDNPLKEVKGELLDVKAELPIAGVEQLTFSLRGVPVVFDVKKQEIACQGKTAPLKPREGMVGLRMLIDRGSVEVFGNDGEVALSAGVLVPTDNQTLDFSVKGGAVKVKSLSVAVMKSAWR